MNLNMNLNIEYEFEFCLNCTTKYEFYFVLYNYFVLQSSTLVQFCLNISNAHKTQNNYFYFISNMIQ